MSTADAQEPATFVLGVASDGFPERERDAAIVRDIVRNRDGFLRYVMLLLAEAGLDGGAFGGGGSMWTRSRTGQTDDDTLPIFESMTRAYCEDPARLGSVDRLLTEMGIGSGGEQASLVPPEFLRLWSVFRDALQEAEEPEP
jgi:hypothetical protein